MLQGFATHRSGKFYADIAADGPLSFWHLDEASGDYRDLGSNGRNLTSHITGITRAVSSIIPSETSKAVTSAGSSQIGDVSAPIILTSLTQSLTTVLTINIPSLPASGQIFGLWHQGNDANSGEQGCLFYLTDTGALGIQVFSGGFRTAQSINGIVGTGTHLIVAVIDMGANQIRFYVDGILADTQVWTFGTGAGIPHQFAVGCLTSNTPQFIFVGTMQGPAIFDKVISAGRITQYHTDW